MSHMSIAEKPAIAGGTKIKQNPYGSEKRYGDEELLQLKEALDQGTLFYAHGKKVHQFESDFAAKNGVPYAVSTTSGTASIHAALIAVGISPGDEVITAPITDMGTVIPILFQGAIPVFADLDPETYEMLPASVEAAITPRTRAVLAVHLWGNSCDLEALKSICDRHNLILIEDCAQAFGCTYHGKPIGTFGEIGCFSCNEFKHISCGDGGIVITSDEKLASRLRLATDKCYNREPGADMRNPIFLANNYRMTELQGAVALAQLKKLDSIVARRNRWCTRLSEELSGVPGISLPRPTLGCEPSYWFYMMRVVPEILKADADTFAATLRAEGLPAGAHYIHQCVYEYPVFKNHSAFPHGAAPYAQYTYEKGICPNAESILDTAVMLSINEAYTENDLNETALAVRRAAEWYANA